MPKHIKFAIAIAVILVLASGGLIIIKLLINNSPEAALRQAKNFKPHGACASKDRITPARHIKTGVEFTFPFGCLPEGWIAL